MRVCVFMCLWRTERAICVYVFVRERERVCVCVCVSGGERVCM